MSNWSPIKINYHTRIHIFQEEKANIYILAPRLLLSHSSSCRTEAEQEKKLSLYFGSGCPLETHIGKGLGRF